MRTVYTSAKATVSLNQIGSFVALQKIHDISMGTSCNTRKVFTKMVNSFGMSMHERLVQHLKSGTGPVSLIADASTDHGNLHFIALLIQGTFIFDATLKDILDPILMIFVASLFILPLLRFYQRFETLLFSPSPFFIRGRLISQSAHRFFLTHESTFFVLTLYFYHGLRKVKNLLVVKLQNTIIFRFRYDCIFFPLLH